MTSYRVRVALLDIWQVADKRSIRPIDWQCQSSEWLIIRRWIELGPRPVNDLWPIYAYDGDSIQLNSTAQPCQQTTRGLCTALIRAFLALAFLCFDCTRCVRCALVRKLFYVGCVKFARLKFVFLTFSLLLSQFLHADDQLLITRCNRRFHCCRL